jgi:hypothetical protein
MRQCRKMWWRQGWQITSQYGAYTLHAGFEKIRALMPTHTPTRPGTHTRARAHAHACIHTPVRNTSWFPTSIMIRERASVLRYTNMINVKAVCTYSKGFKGKRNINIIINGQRRGVAYTYALCWLHALSVCNSVKPIKLNQSNKTVCAPFYSTAHPLTVEKSV